MNRLAKIWLYFAQKNCPQSKIFVGDLGMSSELLSYFESHAVVILPKKKTYEAIGDNFWVNCGYYKVQFLCDFPEPVIYIDIDALILKDLTPLWKLRNEKPFIAVHTGDDERQDINGGVLLLGKPGFLDWPTLKAVGAENSWDFDFADQGLLTRYFSNIGYQPKHELINSSFNTWARDIKWSQSGKEIVCDIDAYVVHFCTHTRPWELKNAKAFWSYKFPGIPQPPTKLTVLFETVKLKIGSYLNKFHGFV